MTMPTTNSEIEKARLYVRGHEVALREKYSTNVIAVVGEYGVIKSGPVKEALRETVQRESHLSIDVLFGTVDEILGGSQ